MTDDIDAVLDPSSSSGPALTGHRHSTSREVSTRLMNSVSYDRCAGRCEGEELPARGQLKTFLTGGVRKTDSTE